MIYLFNKTEELIDVIDEASLIGFTHTIEINQFDRSNFEIPVDYKPDIIKQAQFFGFQSRDGAFCLFKIAEKSYNVGLSIEGIDRAESDLHSFIIEDKRPGGTADQVLNVILERTGYQLGDKNGLTITGNLSLYYVSARQALVKLIEAFGCEFRTRYTFVENKIIGRYIDLYQRFGKVTGHQFEYGSNILNVTYEEDADDVVTALIGRGKGEAKTDSDGEATGGYGRRIQFTDVVWSKAKGDPTDKPAGQNYVTNETSKNIYGLHQNGVIKHRFGVYTNENIDNPVELLKATYKELQRVSVPITTFKANLLDLTNEAGQDMWIGDSVAIVRDQIGIAFEARIHKLKIDKLDENRSAVELGDYETLKEKDRSSRRQALNTLMEGFNESAIEKAIADEAARMDQEFDEKIRVSKLGFDNAVEAIKAKAEENKQALSDEINRRFHEFSPAGFEEAKAKAEEALRKAGAIPDLQNMVQEIDRLQNEVGLKVYRLSNDFQSVKETAQLYERILGNTQNGIADNISRMVMTNQVFQTEVKKYVEDNSNLVFDPTNFSKWTKKQAEANVIEVQAGTRLLRITNNNYEQDVNHGFALPLTTSTFKWGDKLSYRIQAWVDVLPDAPLKIELLGKDEVIASDTVTFDRTGIQIITGTMTVSKSTNKLKEYPLEISLTRNGTVAIGQVSLIRGETPPNEFKDDTSTQDIVAQTQVSQLADSWAVKTLTNAGEIVSQINLNNNNALIEANKIRLKGKTLADEITAIDGYFKRLFVGDARIGTLNTDIIRSNSIAADKLIFDTALAKRLVSSDVFTDTLAAKTAFINKLRSVMVTATFLEGYKGKIGGFQIGTHDKDPTTFWITGINSFRVGMSDGGWRVKQTALWVNWGNNWDKPGNYAWFVNSDGEMHCYNKAQFWNVPRVHGNLEVTGDIFYFIDREKNKVGYWVHSPSYKRLEESNGYVYLYRQAGGYSWIPLNKEISDRRYKTNIQDSPVSALDVIDKLKTYSYRKEYDDKVEDISCGIMAQDVQKYAPEAFLENPDGAYSYNTFALVPYLIKAIQELNQKVERLETTT